MRIVRGIIKEVNVEDLYLVIETLDGEEMEVFTDMLDFEPGTPVLIQGDVTENVINNTRVVLPFPSKKLLELDEELDKKLWEFYGPAIADYNEQYGEETRKMIDKAFGGDE